MRRIDGRNRKHEKYVLEVRGPFDIAFEGKAAKRIPKEAVEAFWKYPEAKELANKHGCYIFALRAAKGFMPWYVGKACRPLVDEAFTADKLEKYNALLWKGRKGTPVMFFVVAEQVGKRKLPWQTVEDLEQTLIQAAVYRNPDVVNIANTMNLPEWNIRGVLRSGRGRPTGLESQFKTMMRL
jgi:hypothetical protein